MTFTLLSIVVVFIFAATLCIEIYRGIKRGFLLSLINLGNIVVSLFLSFAVTSLISSIISGKIIQQLIDGAVYQSIVQELTSIDSLLYAVLEMVIGSILFLIVFCILRIVMFGLFRGIYLRHTEMDSHDPGYGREDHTCSTSLSKKRGAVCGVVAAFMITMIGISPLMGTLELANNVLSIVGNVSTQAITSIGRGNVRLVKEFSDDFAGNVFYRLGGRWIYSNSASTNLNDKQVYLLSEIEVIERMSGDMLKISEILQNPQNATQEHIEALNGLRSNLQETDVLEQLIGEIITECAFAWTNDMVFFSLRRPSLNAMVDPMFFEILEVCTKTNTANAKKNADTILEIYGILLESEVFRTDSNDPGQILNLMARHQMIERIHQAIEKNPNMEDIDASAMMLSAFCSYLKSFQLTEQQYTDFVQNIAFAINVVNSSGGNFEAQKMRELTAYINQYFYEIGMEVSQDVAEMFSSELLREFSNTDVTAAKVKFIFEKYNNG